MNDGNFQKVVIRAYKDKSLRNPTGDEFILPVNPETYSENYKIEYDSKQGQGNEQTDPKYKSSPPLERKLEFIIDGTNTIEGYKYPTNIAGQKLMDVKKQIRQLIITVYKLNGDTHKPNFLKIVWDGEDSFDCILTSLDINYTLFKPDGNPLRAKVSANFLSFVEPQKRIREEDKRSPDLTSVRRVNVDDTLPLACFEVYGDVNLYLQAAKINNLTSIRNVESSRILIFPPLDKTPAS